MTLTLRTTSPTMTSRSDRHDPERIPLTITMIDTDRPCARGCARPGEHYAACPDYGTTDGACKGCVPIEAAEGMLVCDRCARAIRHALDDAPDLIAHLRSIADPTKATAYDRERSGAGRIDLPAPVAADIIDASNDIMMTLREWALHVQFGAKHPWQSKPLEPGIDAAAAYDDARACVDVIVADLDRILNHHLEAANLHDALLKRSADRSPSWWSVGEALGRWPLEDRAHWATQPCPDCGMRSVRVRPPRRAHDVARYRCTQCGWDRDDRDNDAPWAWLFREEIAEQEVRPHDARWLTLAAAARRTGRSPSTVRAWADRGHVKREDGRYWTPDLDTYSTSKESTDA